MPSPTPHVDRFLRSLHRRLIVLRSAERIGFCLLIGCAGAAALIPILWWRGNALLPMTILILTTACGIGLLMALLRRPTQLDAALIADQQLRLHDLLGTVLHLNQRDTDPWQSTVLALADARCRGLSPSAVLLHRWGSRVWGGVALSAALVMTVASVFTHATRTQAEAGALALFDRQDDLGLPSHVRPSSAYSPSRSPLFRTGSPPVDDPSADNAASQTVTVNGHDHSDTKDPASANRHPPSAGDPTGTGAGAAATLAPRSTLPQLPNPGTNANTSGHGPTASGGQSDNGQNNGSSDTLPGGVSGNTAANPSTPPWASPTWPTAQQKALDQIQSHPSYDPYRDLIRDYFKP